MSTVSYMTPEDVCRLMPGMTKGHLAQMRSKKQGPPFRKPTAKTVLYVEKEVIEWIESSATKQFGAI